MWEAQAGGPTAPVDHQVEPNRSIPLISGRNYSTVTIRSQTPVLPVGAKAVDPHA